MKARLSRRQLIQTAGMAAMAKPLSAAATLPGPRATADQIPKICLEAGLAGFGPGGTGDEAGARRVRQLGSRARDLRQGRIPWEESRLKEMMDRLKANGLTLGNLMIGGFNNAIYDRPGRDEDIEKVIQSIRAAGKVGLPVVEYNWYAHRAMEGYFEETGRAGAGWTGFDYEHG